MTIYLDPAGKEVPDYRVKDGQVTMLKLVELKWRQSRKRRAFLQGRIGPYWLTVLMSNKEDLSGIAATIWISSTETIDQEKEKVP